MNIFVLHVENDRNYNNEENINECTRKMLLDVFGSPGLAFQNHIRKPQYNPMHSFHPYHCYLFIMNDGRGWPERWRCDTWAMMLWPQNTGLLCFQQAGDFFFISVSCTGIRITLFFIRALSHCFERRLDIFVMFSTELFIYIHYFLRVKHI